MSNKKTITVFGATGRQGGAVASTYLYDPKLKDEWIVRAAVRDVSKESAKKLAEQGAEVVAVCNGPTLNLYPFIITEDWFVRLTNYLVRPT